MDKDDAEAAFLRHATSKIKSMEDLKNIITLGFRGEALSSIAAVSQIELMTRQPGSMSGYNVINHGGKLIQAREIGCPEGTTIVVRNLFYNTPARLKFLNSTRSETAAISDLIAKLIMANPMVSIRYLNNDKTIYHSPGDDQLINCIISIYGKDIKNELIPVKVELDELSITGYIGKPTITRANRTHQSFFVNGRYIKDNMLTRCVEEALKDWMMVNRFPWCVLHIEIQPEKVDVNVHPSKTEIRFRDPQVIRYILTNSLKKIIEKQPYIPRVFSSTKIMTKDEFSENNSDCEKQIKDYSQGESASNPFIELKEEPVIKKVNIRREIQEDIFSETGMNGKKEDNTIDVYSLRKWNVIGSAFSSFVLIETDTQLYIVDQHAAHERLLFEKLKTSIQNQKVVSQLMLPPYVLEVTNDEFIYITENINIFHSAGFEVEPFGGKSFLIRGRPLALKEVNIGELFRELLDLYNNRKGQGKYILREDDIVKLACKKAVKANDKLSPNELKQLMRDIEDKKIPLTCPHGRPILISISKYELEKRFKRIQ